MTKNETLKKATDNVINSYEELYKMITLLYSDDDEPDGSEDLMDIFKPGDFANIEYAARRIQIAIGQYEVLKDALIDVSDDDQTERLKAKIADMQDGLNHIADEYNHASVKHATEMGALVEENRKLKQENEKLKGRNSANRENVNRTVQEIIDEVEKAKRNKSFRWQDSASPFYHADNTRGPRTFSLADFLNKLAQE